MQHSLNTLMTTTKTSYKTLDSAVLIDDNEIDCFLQNQILKNCGIRHIRTFRSPVTALQYFKKANPMPDLILVDINFPLMDGFGFIEEFKKIKKDKFPLIFILSSSTYPPDILKAQEKCFGFIEKILTKEKLYAQLDKLAIVHTQRSDNIKL